MKNNTFLTGKVLVNKAVEQAIDKKAENIVLLDLTDSMGAAQWLILCQGNNPAHNKAIANDIVHGLKKHSTSPWYVEGHDNGRWILIDYSDVIVHIMLPDLREYYNLEDLWKNAKREDVTTEEDL